MLGHVHREGWTGVDVQYPSTIQMRSQVNSVGPWTHTHSFSSLHYMHRKYLATRSECSPKHEMHECPEYFRDYHQSNAVPSTLIIFHLQLTHPFPPDDVFHPTMTGKHSSSSAGFCDHWLSRDTFKATCFYGTKMSVPSLAARYPEDERYIDSPPLSPLIRP